MSNVTTLRSIPMSRNSTASTSSSASSNGSRAHAAACIKEQMERAGALLLGAQALLREMKDGADEDDREIVAMLLDMAIDETSCLDALGDLEKGLT